MLACVYSDEIITVNIITDKIVYVGYPATFFFGCWQFFWNPVARLSGLLPEHFITYSFHVEKEKNSPDLNINL